MENKTMNTKVFPVVFVIGILSSSFAFSQETCAQKAQRDETVFKHRSPLVISITKKIVQGVPFTKRETDAMPLNDIERTAMEGYNAGFVASLEPKKNIKADILRRFQKSLDDTARGLSPDEATFANALSSKIVSIFSKSFDAGYADGRKPCPQ